MDTAAARTTCGNRTRVARYLRVGLALGLVAVACTGSSAATSPPPLLGANYTHLAYQGCNIEDTGIVAYAHVHEGKLALQLAAMHAAGLRSLRLLLWHMENQGSHRWGVVDSSSGTLSPLARQNLVAYLRGAREAGFERVTISFGPMWENDVVGFPDDHWAPRLFEDNWRIIASVRALAKRHGPPQTRFDLQNEIAPSSYTDPSRLARIEDYIARMYARYVRAFGHEDVSFSVISKDATQGAERLAHLIRALRSTGLPLPTWVDLHPSYTSTALDQLRQEEQILRANDWAPKIVLGEVGYETPAGADAIATFARESSLVVEEIDQWPLRSEPCSGRMPNPPFRADAYARAFTGSPPPSSLTAVVAAGGRTTLTTPYGRPLRALTAGSWRLQARDRSSRTGFNLRGPRISIATGSTFRGTRAWNLRLRPGTYRFSGGSFRVLASG